MRKDNKWLNGFKKSWNGLQTIFYKPDNAKDLKQEDHCVISEQTSKLNTVYSNIPTTLLGLPKEIWAEILMYLHWDDIAHVNQVCKFLVVLSNELQLAEKKYPYYIRVHQGLNDESVWSVWDNDMSKVLHLPESMKKESQVETKPQGWFKLELNSDEAKHLIASRAKSYPGQFISKELPITQNQIVAYTDSATMTEIENPYRITARIDLKI